MQLTRSYNQNKQVSGKKSHADKMAAQRVVIEQSLEWHSSLYLNFVQFEKVFDSVDHNLILVLLK